MCRGKDHIQGQRETPGREKKIRKMRTKERIKVQDRPFSPYPTLLNQHLPCPRQAPDTTSGSLRHPDTEGQSPVQ